MPIGNKDEVRVHLGRIAHLQDMRSAFDALLWQWKPVPDTLLNSCPDRFPTSFELIRTWGNHNGHGTAQIKTGFHMTSPLRKSTWSS